MRKFPEDRGAALLKTVEDRFVAGLAEFPMAAVSRNRVRPGAEVTAHLIEAEFREMPGMRLTHAQIRRLWNLSQPECDEVLERLRRSGSLVMDEAGRYTRRRTCRP